MTVKHGLTLAVSLALSAFAAQAADTVTPPAGYKPQASSARVDALAGNDVLLVKDVDPWGTTADDTVLTSLGIGYDVIPSSGIATAPLGNYCVVIVASDQPQTFYDAFNASLPQVTSFVQNGGVLEFHGADNGFQGGTWASLPGGVTHNVSMDNINLVVNAANPIVAGIPSPFNGSYASHDVLVGLPAGADIVTSDSVGQPTTAVYKVGRGSVIATGNTLEAAYGWSFDFAQMLPNMISYAHSNCGTKVYGRVVGLGLRTLQCENTTTGQVVSGAVRGKAWSCADLGLTSSKGDKVRVTIGGVSQ